MKMGDLALKYLPDAGALWFNIANVRGKLEQWEESERCFLTAIRLDTREARYHLNLGQSLLVDGRYAWTPARPATT